ncbi:MAG: histidine triad nucleotide-binding protein [Actinomycetota bacterium]|nr:histidine triad nucleotide-binding protein [Actinomycetota bacterium]
MKDGDCLFCKIIAEEIPADVIFDRGGVIAFRDVNPQAPLHALVVPKDHVRDAAAVDASHGSLLVELIGAANEIAEADGVDASGYRLVLNVGADAGQTVFHLHLHVIGGRPMAWPPG